MLVADPSGPTHVKTGSSHSTWSTASVVATMSPSMETATSMAIPICQKSGFNYLIRISSIHSD